MNANITGTPARSQHTAEPETSSQYTAEPETIIRNRLLHHILTLSSGTVAHVIGSPFYDDINNAIGRTIRYIENGEGAIPVSNPPSMQALCDLIRIANCLPAPGEPA